MHVPLLDLKAQYAPLKTEIMAAVERVFDDQAFVLGKDVELLERELEDYCRVPRAIACASGTDALLLALMALDLKPGDEVVTTPYTFFATAGSIARLGLKTVFVDIDPKTFNINPELVEEKITSRTRAIMPVHLFGQCADMDAINSIAARHGLPVIEDAAQAVGARWNDRPACSMGVIGCLSFYPTKNLGGAGDGGCVTTLDDELAKKLRSLRVHGETTRYHHQFVGVNSRLDTLQAVVLRIKLKRLDEWSAARARHAAEYDRLFAETPGLGEFVETPYRSPRAGHIFNQYVIRARRRDELKTWLHGQGIGTGIYYPLSLHEQPCFADLGYRTGDFPESERAARESLALPVYPELTAEMRAGVVEAIARFYGCGG